MTDNSDGAFFEDESEDGGADLNTSSQILDDLDAVDAVALLEEHVNNIEHPLGVWITLFDYYTDMERIDEAGEALTKAAKLVSKDQYKDMVFFLYNQLELFSQLNQDAGNAFERLGRLIADDEGDIPANTVHIDQRKLYNVDLVPELLLARHLHRASMLSDAEMLICLQDLCWCSNNPLTEPKSLLYVLEDRGLPHREKAMSFMAEDASIPYIDLKLVNFDDRFIDVLPLEFTQRRAACVIGEVGDQVLVGLLNPYNLQLRDDVMRELDAAPHFFMTSAEGYYTFLNHQAGREETPVT